MDGDSITTGNIEDSKAVSAGQGSQSIHIQLDGDQWRELMKMAAEVSRQGTILDKLDDNITRPWWGLAARANWNTIGILGLIFLWMIHVLR